ncbi:MAG: penicillin-binding protein activator [Xanthomonadaceae bacterium]|nr:penicillin-binding protein activator [Xanthomonadaceae bacterium]MDE1958201.1 penicillin-binding protein activator [Xanthomonadaceae bacterium]MDE2176790.1 penicillin-binding protein activator [Xanthomonadaceae bacterium]MDE2245014.1 penicillin-binding protein activator [Xanthomonadaceae bacterium]
MHRLRALLLPVIAVLLLAGCASLGGPTPAQQAQAAQAQALDARGDYAGAARGWLDLAAQGGAAGDGYRLRAAEALQAGGLGGRADAELTLVHRSRLGAGDRARFDLLSAERALARKDPQHALRLVAGLPAGLSPDETLRAQRVQALASAAIGDRWAAAVARVRMESGLRGAAATANQRALVSLLAGLGAGPLKQRAAALPASDPMLPWIGRALAKLGTALPRSLPELASPVGTQVAQGQGALREGYRAYQRIAVLLPQSGPLAAAGRAVRDGFLTDYFESARDGQPRPLVRFYDSQGTAAGAVTAYRQAVADGAQLVVGPLAREGVAALFAQPLPVPLLALNHPDNGTSPPPGSAEFALMPESEGAQTAARMLADGLRNALVFHGDDDAAVRAARAFAAQFEAGGGTVIGSAQLPVGSVNYASAIRSAIAGGVPANTGIFMAVRPEQGRLLLPQLRVARLRQPAYATASVYGLRDDPNADRDLDGIEFGDAPWLFDAQPGLPSRSELSGQLPDVDGRAARLFAFGMDAWALVPYLDWLRAHPGSYVAGATGQLTADAQGHIQRVPLWLRFDNGLARPLAGGLQLSPPAGGGTEP